MAAQVGPAGVGVGVADEGAGILVDEAVDAGVDDVSLEELVSCTEVEEGSRVEELDSEATLEVDVTLDELEAVKVSVKTLEDVVAEGVIDDEELQDEEVAKDRLEKCLSD